MNITPITRRFIPCPGCGSEYGFSVEHLMHEPGRTFGPWSCTEHTCDVIIRGKVEADGTITLEVSKREGPRGFALLRLGDLWLVYEERYGRVENWDYFYHSHQCPTNLLREVYAVFDEGGSDPHGHLRYIAGIDDTPEVRQKLDDCNGSLADLLKLFDTDGTPPETEWLEEDGGVLPVIAQWRREAKEGT